MIAEKFATTLLFAFITIVVGFAVVDRSPLQFANVKPATGVAVSVTTVPAGIRRLVRIGAHAARSRSRHG